MEPVANLEVKKIVTALAEVNVTETVLARFKANYLPLKIDGLGDKEGYEAVKKARLECKNTRVLTEKICKKGREAAIAEQKAWIVKQNQVIAEIKVVEDHLTKEEDWFDTETAKAKLIALRTQQLPLRKIELTKVSAIVPTDEILLGMDDMAFMNYLNNERTRILNEKEAALQAKEKEQEIAKINAEKGPDSFGLPYVLKGDEKVPGMVFATAIPNIGIRPSTVGEAFGEIHRRSFTDKESLASFAEYLYNFPIPEVKGEVAKKALEEVRETIFALSVKIATVAETL
jgi:hypothetical protein